MKRIALVSLCFSLFTFICFSQTDKHKSLKLENISTLFSKLVSLKNVPERGEFETIDDYKKRLPAPFDTSREYFLSVTEPRSILEPLHRYDIDNQLLTFEAGTSRTNGTPDQYKPLSGKLVTILSKVNNKGSYKGANAFGAKVTVEKSEWHYYLVNIVNPECLPDSLFDEDNCSFTFTVSIPPKQAKTLSGRALIVIGLKLLGPDYSTEECVFVHEPKIDNPDDYSIFSHLIEARIVSVILYDKISGIILHKIKLDEQVNEPNKSLSMPEVQPSNPSLIELELTNNSILMLESELKAKYEDYQNKQAFYDDSTKQSEQKKLIDLEHQLHELKEHPEHPRKQN